MPRKGARPGAPGTEVGGSGGRAAPLLRPGTPRAPPRERPIAAVRRSASASRTAPSPSPVQPHLPPPGRAPRSVPFSVCPPKLCAADPCPRPPGEGRLTFFPEPTPDLPGHSCRPCPTAAGQPGLLDSAAATPACFPRGPGPSRDDSQPPHLRSLTRVPSSSGRRGGIGSGRPLPGHRPELPRAGAGREHGARPRQGLPRPPTAATHERRGQRAGTVPGRYAASWARPRPTPGLSLCPGGHCAPHSRAGRSSPAPRRRPQEPTINRVTRRAEKSPGKSVLLCQTKFGSWILSSPSARIERAGGEGSGFITPPGPRTLEDAWGSFRDSRSPGEPKVGRRVAPQPGGVAGQ